MDIWEAIEHEIRTDAKLTECVGKIAAWHYKSPRGKTRASIGFLQKCLTHDAEGLELYQFFETFRKSRGLGQKQCPQRYLLTVLQKLVREKEVEWDA